MTTPIAATATATYPEVPLTRGVKELMEAAPGYEKAEAYYEGEVDVAFANSNIERYIGRTKNRYRLNFSKMIVNALSDRLEIASVVVPQNKTLTALLNKIYIKNRMHRKGRTVHRRAILYGDAYLFVWPEDPESPNIRFEVHYNSPKTTRVIYRREHPDSPEYAIKMWREPSPLGPPTWRVNLYFPEQVEKYVMTLADTAGNTTATTYYPDPYRSDLPSSPANPADTPSLDPQRWDEIETIPNPYNTIPIFHFRNDEPYGKPRHKDGYGAQDAINKLSSTLLHTSDFQGFPQRYGLADANAQIGGENDATTPWNDEDALDDRDGQVESGPGTFIRLQGIRAAGSFPAAAPEAFMDPSRFYLRSMAQITTTPLRFFDPVGEPPSGEALRAMDAPLNKEATDTQDMFEESWADLYEFMLRILRKVTPSLVGAETDPDDPDDGLQVDIQWKPVTSIDDNMGWETIQKKVETGVPTRQALMEAGYSQAQVDAWLANNENRSLLDHDSEILVRIAEAAKNLSAATGQGIMDPQIAQHILTKLLNKLLNETLDEPRIKEDPITQPQPNPNPDGDGGPQNNGHVLDSSPQSSRPAGGGASAEAARRFAPLPHQ